MTTVVDIFSRLDLFINQQITVAGWVKTVRESKNVNFIELNDGSCFKNLQLVVEESSPAAALLSQLNVGTSLIAQGILRESPAPKQPVELTVTNIDIVGQSPDDYPLQKKRHSFEFLRTIAHLRPRSNTFLAVFRLRSLLAYAIHSFFQQENFVYVHTPIITSSDCEGAGQMFRVSTLDLYNLPKTESGQIDFREDFFGKEAFLTVSGQLNVECFCQAFGRVYTFGPTFRAENSNTQRHAAEFWMIEPEIAFATLKENRELAERMMKFICSEMLEKASDELKFFNNFIEPNLLNRLENLVNSSFETITYTEAIALLQKSNQKFNYQPQWGCDLQTEHERYLTENVFKKPVFVIDYPKEIKAFYMRLNDDGKTVAAMDLLVPEVGEIIGGSQREERYDVLVQRIRECGLNEETYWWYLDLRRFGSVPHAGFGLGFERALMYLSGMPNIRDVIPFFRTPKNIDF